MADEISPNAELKAISLPGADDASNTTVVDAEITESNTTIPNLGADVAAEPHEEETQSDEPAAVITTEEDKIASAAEDDTTAAFNNTEESLIDSDSDNQAKEGDSYLEQCSQLKQSYTNNPQDHSSSSYKSLIPTKPSDVFGKYVKYSYYDTKAGDTSPKVNDSKSPKIVSSEDNNAVPEADDSNSHYAEFVGSEDEHAGSESQDEQLLHSISPEDNDASRRRPRSVVSRLQQTFQHEPSKSINSCKSQTS